MAGGVRIRFDADGWEKAWLFMFAAMAPIGIGVLVLVTTAGLGKRTSSGGAVVLHMLGRALLVIVPLAVGAWVAQGTMATTQFKPVIDRG